MNNREPVIWFDKATLGADNIAESLKCLPIFLASCKQLVILAGPQCE